jgi:hypothetical protein
MLPIERRELRESDDQGRPCYDVMFEGLQILVLAFGSLSSLVHWLVAQWRDAVKLPE